MLTKTCVFYIWPLYQTLKCPVTTLTFNILFVLLNKCYLRISTGDHSVRWFDIYEGLKLETSNVKVIFNHCKTICSRCSLRSITQNLLGKMRYCLGFGFKHKKHGLNIYFTHFKLIVEDDFCLKCYKLQPILFSKYKFENNYLMLLIFKKM